jgi:16S rRNA (cytosine967-C5)-methyltransferase
MRPTSSLKQSDARRLAFDVLRQVEEQGAAVRGAVDRACETARPSPADRGLLREIAAGVMRRRLSLDAVIDVFSAKPPDEGMRRALRIGLYQILYLDRVPTRAAVDTTVELVRSIRPHATGFANAVLRAAARSLLARDDRPGPHPRRALPVARDLFAVFDRDILPDPREHEAGHLAVAHSHPEWIVRRWLAAVGAERTLARLRAGNRRPRTFLRVRPGRGDALRERLTEAGVPFAPVPDHADALRLEGDHLIRTLPGYTEGWFTVQDPTAQAIAPILGAAAGERILDVGAAPGGKTAHLADLAGDAAHIVAADLIPGRLRRVIQTCDRLGLTSVRPLAIDASRAGFLGGATFDRILIDAPCSNTGVLRRRVEARWRLTEDDLPKLTALQADFLRAAAPMVRPGGALLYGTCSLEEEENRLVVATFLRENRAFRMADEQVFEVGAGDGGYAARLRRRAV